MSVTFLITPQRAAQLRKPIRGKGGYQDILKRFRAGLCASNTHAMLTVSDADFMRLARYMVDYGQGGFEDRLLRLIGLKS